MYFVPLYIKSDYSILSSLVKIDDLIIKLKEYKITSAALVDDNLYGTMEFYTKCIKNNIKPIIGLEIDIGFKVIIYAKNYHGYQNLCIINTLKNKKELSKDNLNDYLDDTIVVLLYGEKEKESYFTNCEVFIGYKNEDERKNLKNNKVYMNKVLSLNKDDIKYLDYLYKINGKTYDGDLSVYLKEDIDALYKKDNLYFSNLCNLKIEKNINLLPKYNSDSSFDPYIYLTKLCLYGLEKRIGKNISLVYKNRLNYELSVIKKLNFCNYFLIVWDYVKYAKKNNILKGPGRGSSASSLVSYLLGITDIDPIKYNLLFERFLNPKRVTMPDIDIDFDALRKDEIINYVTNKYGKDNVCGIITFSNLTAKQIIRDLGKIFNISSYEIDSLLQYFDDKKTLKQTLDNEFVKMKLSKNKNLYNMYQIAMKLEGIKRHISKHAAGIIISSCDLKKYIPLMVDGNGDYLCGYTMNYIEELGFLKMDFLSLKNLSLVNNIISKVNVNFNDIKLDDEKTFNLFKEGKLDGIFQFESNGMKKFLTELSPSNINELIDAVALFRPGPIDNITHYIKRKYKKEKIDYISEDLKDILFPTYGIIIYQEQIMQIANKMAGFSYEKADDLRRAMSKKKEDLLLFYKDEFIKGSVNKGYDINLSEKVYNMILKFANYGFNKAHSVSYAILGYKIAYLKANYTINFMCEILNSNFGNKNKIKLLIDEAKSFKIEIEKPNINISTHEFIIHNKKLIYPLSMIKTVSTLVSKSIVENRDNNGNYTSYIDFIIRNYMLDKNTLNAIILSGALDIFGYNRKTMIENLDNIINYSYLCNDLDKSLVAIPEIIMSDEYTKEELSKYEFNYFGFYLDNHPTFKYITNESIKICDLEKYFDKNINIILYFERKKEVITKNKEKMMFISASDVSGNIDLVLFPKIYEKYFNVLTDKCYNINAKVEKRISKIQLVVKRIDVL